MEIDATIWISYNLEGPIANNNESVLKTLRGRINLILGSPNTDKNWLNSFYNLRSRLVHGDFPVIRMDCDEFVDPNAENYYSRFPIDKALAVLLALLKKLIINNSGEFVFEERFYYKQIDNVTFKNDMEE
jgi:hypothetical protein